MSKLIYEKNRILYDFKQPDSVKLIPTDVQIVPFDDQTYEFSDTMTASFPTGDYFCDGDKSYLSVKIKITGNDPGESLKLNFGRGSIANLWNSIRIYHASGTEISNVQNIDIWTKNRQTMSKDTFWKESVGYIQGYRQDPSTEFIYTSNPSELQFKIKLSELHPFFKGTEGKLLPKEIINDLRIELDTNLVNKVFTQGAAPISEILTAQISKCELQLALVDLMDEAQDVVSDMANKDGLKWAYSDVFITTKVIGATENTTNVNIDKACSMAKNIVSVIRATDETNLQSDSYTWPEVFANRWNYRVANVLYPYKRQVAETADSYSSAIDTYSWEFGTNLKYVDFVLNNSNYTTCLKTDDQLLHSGDYLNANKRVEFELEKGTLSTSSFIHSCLEYVKVLRVNDTNSRIDS